MTVPASLAPVFVFRAFDANGLPLAGGKLWSYAAGTSTPLATFTDQSGATAAANPIILDANGQCPLWLGVSAYKFNLLDHNDAQQSGYPVDNVQSVQMLINAVYTRLADTTDAANGDVLVGVKAAGTGAVGTTQHEVNARTINVFDFLTTAQKTAVTSRTPDDTSGGRTALTGAIQNAINATPEGGVLHFPVGIYRHNGLTMTHKMTMEGDGYRSELQLSNTVADTVSALHIYPSDNADPVAAAVAGAGWRLRNIRIAPQDTVTGPADTPVGKYGVFLDVSPAGQGWWETHGTANYPAGTTSLNQFCFDHVNVEEFAEYSCRVHEAALTAFEDSKTGNIAWDHGADTNWMRRHVMHSSRPTKKCLYIDIYNGGNQFIIEDSSITCNGTQEMLYVVYSGMFTCKGTQWEPQGDFADGTDYAMNFLGTQRTDKNGQPYGCIVAPNFKENNFNINGVKAIARFDNCAFPRLEENQYAMYPGFHPAAFETVKRDLGVTPVVPGCWGLEFLHNVNVQPGISDSKAAFDFSESVIGVNAPVSLEGSIAGTTLTITILHGGSLLAYISGSLTNRRMNLYGVGVPAGLQIKKQLTGSDGDIGTYELTVDGGTVASCEMLASFPTFIDNGDATVGIWNYPPLYVGADGTTVSDRFLNEQPGWCMVEHGKVELRGGAAVTIAGFPGNPGANSEIFNDMLPVWARPDFTFATQIACQLADSSWDVCTLTIDSGGGVYIRKMPLTITKVYLDGVSYHTGIMS